MSLTTNSKILSSDVNSVFNRLEAIRAAHYSGAGQTAAGKAALNTTFNITPTNQSALAKEPFSLMKSYLNVLRNSVFLAGITQAQVDAIEVPSAGTLIKLTSMTTGTNLISTIEGLPSSYTTNFSSFRGSSFDSSFRGGSFDGSFRGSSFDSSFRSSSFHSSFRGSSFNSSQHSGYGTSSWGAKY